MGFNSGFKGLMLFTSVQLSSTSYIYPRGTHQQLEHISTISNVNSTPLLNSYFSLIAFNTLLSEALDVCFPLEIKKRTQQFRFVYPNLYFKHRTLTEQSLRTQHFFTPLTTKMILITMDGDTGNLHVVAQDETDIFRTETSSSGKLTTIIMYNVIITTIICLTLLLLLLLLHCFELSFVLLCFVFVCVGSLLVILVLILQLAIMLLSQHV